MNLQVPSTARTTLQAFRLACLKTSLMQNLLTGKVRVKPTAVSSSSGGKE